MPAQPASHAVSASTPLKTVLASAFTRSFLSAAFELGLALLVEGADAFLAVFGSDEAIVGRDLELHCRSEVHAEPLANGAPRLANRERCVGGDSRSGLQRRIEQARRLAQPVDDAPGKRLLRRKGP